MEPRSSKSSSAELFLQLPRTERAAKLAKLSAAERAALPYLWPFWRRPQQALPEGDWSTWLILAGRGFGKTRTGSETVRIWIKSNPIVNIAGPTAADARDVMVEGPGGILAICPRDERPAYLKSDRQLKWPNGAVSLIFSADEPDRFRGPQCHKFWADELAAWRYPEAWDQAMFGLRLGDNPQSIVTTTPKPTKLVRELVKAPSTHVTRGSTYDNRGNLARQFFEQIITKYEGTRLGRQELDAELLEDNPGALWNQVGIDADRVAKMPELRRIVIAVDPAVTAKEESDEWGIVAVGMDAQRPPHFYVFDDLSAVLSPNAAARVVVNAYRDHRADRVVAETNNGGDMVEAIIRNADENVAYTAVHASRGKIIRAEPAAALYEQHRVHHVGFFPQLESQMCDFNPATDEYSPDRMDALVWGLAELAANQSGLLGYYADRAKRNEAPKEAKMPAKPATWSEPIRVIAMGITPDVSKADWAAVAEELELWIEHVKDDPARKADAEAARKRLVKKFGEPR